MRRLLSLLIAFMCVAGPAGLYAQGTSNSGGQAGEGMDVYQRNTMHKKFPMRHPVPMAKYKNYHWGQNNTWNKSSWNGGYNLSQPQPQQGHPPGNPSWQPNQ